ncbi:zinc finger protein 836 [Aedes albopictus]|uniref:C2h2-type zn-finger protein n=1 Tax=Aedes albopictus TaxID=7160 RepID=A0ABM1XKQ1_AEDAL
MAFNSETNPANLCRVCIQDVTYIPSENIFQSSDDPGHVNLYRKLSVICSQVFAAEPDGKPSATEVLAMPLSVCHDCKGKIDDAYELHRMCLESHRLLGELLAPKLEEVMVKKEPEDPVEDTLLQLDEPKVFADILEVPSKKPSARGKGRRSRVKQDISNEEVATAKNPEDNQENPAFSCEKCGAVAKREFALHKHMKMKHPKDVFQCDKCYEVYFDEAKMLEHRKNHDLEKPYACPICQKRFKRRRDVTLHSVLCKGQTPFLCTECGKGYAYASSLVQHLLRHKEKSMACDLCPVKFHTKGALNMHIRLTHNKEKNYVCHICSKRCVSSDALKKHLLCHTGERQFKCDVCDMKFLRRNNMMRHMRTHTGEKPYKCTHCDRAFSQTNDLVKHSKVHFGDNPYKCDRCDAAYRLLSELRDHYKVHSGSGYGSSDQPDNFKFTSVSALQWRAAQERQNDVSQSSAELKEGKVPESRMEADDEF